MHVKQMANITSKLNIKFLLLTVLIQDGSIEIEQSQLCHDENSIKNNLNILQISIMYN